MSSLPVLSGAWKSTWHEYMRCMGGREAVISYLRDEHPSQLNDSQQRYYTLHMCGWLQHEGPLPKPAQAGPDPTPRQVRRAKDKLKRQSRQAARSSQL